jgi:hypothetical protein
MTLAPSYLYHMVAHTESRWRGRQLGTNVISAKLGVIDLGSKLGTEIVSIKPCCLLALFFLSSFSCLRILPQPRLSVALPSSRSTMSSPRLCYLAVAPPHPSAHARSPLCPHSIAVLLRTAPCCHGQSRLAASQWERKGRSLGEKEVQSIHLNITLVPIKLGANDKGAKLGVSTAGPKVPATSLRALRCRPCSIRAWRQWH